MTEPTQGTIPSTLTLQVEGMDCGGCERKVEAALGRLEGIGEVSASSVTGSVRIHPQQDTTPSHEAIERILNELGYQLATDDEGDEADAAPASWWQTAKGRLVLVTGGCWLWPSFSAWSGLA
jgi:Cd2+/Zn2+-exporting ATPase